MINFLLYIWQLPQNLLGKILYLIMAKKIHTEGNILGVKVFWMEGTKFGVSLGKYIFLSIPYHNDVTARHEYGHCIQSIYLGPLYLLLIGLPSLTMNRLTYFGILKRENYYKRWPENWADKLGGVKR